MKNTTRHLLLLLLVFISLTASNCKRHDVSPLPTPANPQLTLQFKMNASGSPFSFNQILSNKDGQRYLIYTLLFYVGNVRLVNSTGADVPIQDILLVNFDDSLNRNDPTHDPNTVGTSFNITIPAGTFTALKFGVGVPLNLDGYSKSGKNSTDYPISHPLSSYRGLYWDWVGIYRFAMIEGRADTSKLHNQTPNLPFAYHTGYDSLYYQVQFPDAFSISAGATHKITIDLDVNKIFYNATDSILIAKEANTNMNAGNIPEGKLGVRVEKNLVNALTKE